MKKLLLFLFSSLAIVACQPGRVVSQSANTPEISTIHLKMSDELTASLDTTHQPVNAAQISEPVTPATIPHKASRRHSLRESIKIARQLIRQAPTDSTDLYKRRQLPDTRPINKTAKASLVLGIGAFVFVLLSGVGVPIVGLLAILAAIGGVVTGIIALSELRKNPDLYRGKGQAIAGLVLGSTLLFLLIVAIVLIIAVFSNWQ